MRLEGKVALITGGGRGIGRGIAHRLAEEGAAVTVVDILGESARETATEIAHKKGQSLGLQVDITNLSEIDEMLAQVFDTFGQLDILVNNAGVMGQKPILEITEEDWDRTMSVNLKGVFFCSQAVVRYFLKEKRQGKIVNIASVESEIAWPDSIPYATSKGGVTMLTKAMAYDLAAHGINVNAVGPGSTDTGKNYLDSARRKAYEGLIPMRKIGTPNDIANAVLFLSSPESDYVTGHTLYVDGGLLTGVSL